MHPLLQRLSYMYVYIVCVHILLCMHMSRVWRWGGVGVASLTPPPLSKVLCYCIRTKAT